ncbi:MAG TPA: hypothetical protein P5205_11600 [Candidatus Paceibacterota bacterium]|nr:hypothetical protein [Verrucomicrobiota bacterium]HSA11003.1 hypothetical protein [Candidatus Paceibacterota bacterium]
MQTPHQCSGCLSRRRCLQVVTTAAAGLVFSGEFFPAIAKARKADPDFVDPAKLRPRPSIRVDAAVLQQPRPYWLGWPGTTYDLDKRQKEYRSQLAGSCARLAIKLHEEEKPIEDEAGMTVLLKGVRERKPDGLLVILQHMQCWNWVHRLANEAGVPLIVFSPIGTSFTGHVNGISRQQGVYVVSSLGWSAVEDGLRMIRAKRMFEETRMLWIHGNRRNETVLDHLGTKVRAIPRDAFNQLFDKMPANEEVKDVASSFRKRAKRVVEPTWQDSVNSARVYTAAKRMLADEQANALSMDCLGMVGAKLVPTPPCGAWTLLEDLGITCGCEADLHGATSLMLTSYLLDRPGYMNDPVAETAKNLLIASHCVAGTRLNGFDQKPAPYILRSHSESALGVSVQVLWPVGEPVSLIRFKDTDQLIIDTGTVVSNVDTPPAGGCRTSVEIKMDNVEDCRDVLGFHQVVTLGNHRRVVEAFCQLYGIKVIHSPRNATHGKAG